MKMPLIYKTNLKKRIYATLVDYGFYLTFYIVYIYVFGHNNDEGKIVVEGVATLPLMILWVLYFIIAEGYSGATLGHHLFDLKVVTLSQRFNISYGEAFKRHILDVIDIYFYGIPAIIIIKNTDKHQRLGDLWAKTIVVDTKDPEQYDMASK